MTARVSDDVVLAQLDAGGTPSVADELADLYRSVYGSKEPQASDPFYGRDQFLSRLGRYRQGRGFTLVTARLGLRLVGFVYGYVLAPGTTWWEDIDPPVSRELVQENGQRTFAINDMVVAVDRRGQGIAHAMHDELIATHPSMRFTLTMRPDNMPARRAYENWGYRVLGQQRAFPDSPIYDVMLLER